MRRLGIRRYMLLGMLTFVAFPALAYTTVDVLNRRVFQSSAAPQMQQDAALREIAGSAARWRDPAWQRTTQETLGALGIGAVLRDPFGTEIFRTGPTGTGGHAPWWAGQPSSRQATVFDGGRELGTVALSGPQRGDGTARTAAIIAFVLVLLNVGWQMRRSVITPLEAMGRAARRIAAGDLDFTLPRSRVREIAEVRDAFEAMGAGLRASIAQQAALEEERRFFVGAIAHDLRTPLFALRGFLVGMEQGLASSPERAARYIALSRQKADQLDRLVEDLFAYTKAEYLEQTLHREWLEIGPLLERVVDGLRPPARDKGVAIALEGPDDSPTLDGDAHLLERALENLLDNALRHTPAGGTITVRWRAEPERASFTVADTGPGIAARDLPHLFEPLYRGEASRNRETGGAGLGLTIARRILRAHGGDLVAANGAEGGAEFTSWLPCGEARGER